MALPMLSMMMEAMKGIVGMPEVVGDEVEAVVSVAVEGEASMVLKWMLSMMLEATIKKHHEVHLSFGCFRSTLKFLTAAVTAVEDYLDVSFIKRPIYIICS